MTLKELIAELQEIADEVGDDIEVRSIDSPKHEPHSPCVFVFTDDDGKRIMRIA